MTEEDTKFYPAVEGGDGQASEGADGSIIKERRALCFHVR